jgi:glycosyltransferase involved in cell wall biosynthesis
MSAAQLAEHVYIALSRVAKVLYADDPKFVRTRLLFATDNWWRCQDVKADCEIIFPAVAHLRFTRDVLLPLVKGIQPRRGQFDRLYEDAVIRKFEEGLKRARTIVLIGNKTIENTYLDYGVPKEKLVTMNYGIDPVHFSPRERDRHEPKFVFLSAFLSVRKGFPVLMAAWEKAQREGLSSRATLDVIGDVENSECDVAAFTHLANLTFQGLVVAGSDEHLRSLNSAHYVICSSLSEGQVGTLLEAMACGCVPIATRESGIDADQYGGWVIKAGDVGDLHRVLAFVAETHDQESWQKRSMTTREQCVRNHDWQAFETRIEQIGRQVLTM